MSKVGKYLSATRRRKILKTLSWTGKETALLQPIIDYIFISCPVSVTAAVGIIITWTNIQNMALIFKCMMRSSDFTSKNSPPMTPYKL